METDADLTVSEDFTAVETDGSVGFEDAFFESDIFGRGN